jgi:ATP-dependent DNA helicase RecG
MTAPRAVKIGRREKTECEENTPKNLCAVSVDCEGRESGTSQTEQKPIIPFFSCSVRYCLSPMDLDSLQTLVTELAALSRETEWVEFKHNNEDPKEIGEYLSAISNSAALHGRDRGFIVWGIEDGSHKIVGTTFVPHKAKVGAHELEHWLATQLQPRIDFRIHEGQVNGLPVVVFEVPAAAHTPVRFQDFDHIRVGSYRNKLRDHPEKERQLWTRLERGSFEATVARADLTVAEVLDLLDAASYFQLTQQPTPTTSEAIVARLVDDRLVIPKTASRFDLLNVGAILFAKKLSNFDRLGRKSVRIVTYEGNGRTRALREHVEERGYATAFRSMVDYIDSQLPRRERVEHGLRTDLRAYPEDTIREPLGNALIHQDFTVTGAGLIVEIFIDRVEITNPGTPLVPPDRFIDAAPKSRNEALAALMRRMRICEERGSGIDKVVEAVEASLLPAPNFAIVTDQTRVTVLGPRGFPQMTKEERQRACYQHACLQWVANQRMTNSSLRKRFGITDENYATASRVIADTIEAGLVKPFDPKSESKKHAQYVPYWV